MKLAVQIICFFLNSDFFQFAPEQDLEDFIDVFYYSVGQVILDN